MTSTFGVSSPRQNDNECRSQILDGASPARAMSRTLRLTAGSRVRVGKPGGKNSVRQMVEYQSDASMVVAGDVVLIRSKILDKFETQRCFLRARRCAA